MKSTHQISIKAQNKHKTSAKPALARLLQVQADHVAEHARVGRLDGAGQPAEAAAHIAERLALEALPVVGQLRRQAIQLVIGNIVIQLVKL